MASSFSRKRLGTPERRRALVVLAVLAAAIVPASIAWACNPQAYLRISPTTVAPGGQLNVSGAFFKAGANLTISIDGGASTSVTTNGNGSFSTTMPAPTASGSYSVSAVGFEPDGTVTNGLPARASFTVGTAGPSGQPASPQAGGPGAAPSQPGAAAPNGGRFAEPEVPSTGTFRTPGSRSDGARERVTGGGGGGSAGPGAVSAGAGVIDSSAGTVFSGSIAREDRLAEAGGGTRGAAPSQRAAGSDIWAGFDSASAPSLRADGDEAAPSGGAGSQLGWGLGLAALGFVALVSGLVASEARRRRAATR